MNEETLDSVFRSHIGKVVAFVLTPVLAVAMPPVVQFLNDALGTDFSDQQLSNIAVATVVGLALVAWQWLRNRGDWEKQVVELHTLYEAGRQTVEGQDPTVPPGTV